MQPHLIVTDLDNTLLNREHDLDALTIDTFQTVVECGHHVALASGRHFHDIAAFRRRLGIDAHILSTNGAHLYAPDDTLIAEQWVPHDLVRELVRLPRDTDIRLNLYTGDGWLIDAPAPELLTMHERSGFRYEVADLEAHEGRGVGKVLCTGNPEALAALEESIRASLGARLHITYSMANSLEIMAEGVNKGVALERLLARLDIPAARCLAFGDNLNDAEMLQVAGHGFIMAHAHPDLPRLVPQAERIGDHHAGGVALRLREYFGLDVPLG